MIQTANCHVCGSLPLGEANMLVIMNVGRTNKDVTMLEHFGASDPTWAILARVLKMNYAEKDVHDHFDHAVKMSNGIYLN